MKEVVGRAMGHSSAGRIQLIDATWWGKFSFLLSCESEIQCSVSRPLNSE